MKKMLLIGPLLLVSAGLLQAGEPSSSAPIRRATTGAAVLEGNNEFALKLYGRLRSRPGNIVCSPASVRIALAMAQVGARSRTAGQMMSVLGLPSNGESVHDAFGVALRKLGTEFRISGCEVRLASSLWGQAGVRFREPFLRTVRRSYEAGFSTLDFGRPEEAREIINAWAARVTEGRIREILEPELLSADVQLVLANAIRFDGAWARGFPEASTRNRPFRPSSLAGEEARDISIPTMHQVGEFGYRRDPDADVLEMPYEGGALSMVILLPRARKGLAALEASLSVRNLETRLQGLSRRTVAVFLPRFEIGAPLRLESDLAALGMPDAFDGAVADLSGMTGEKGLWIFAVAHEVLMSVDEDGTEMAAAGAVVVGRGGSEFRADRPFLFFVRERRTGAILFLGRVADPSTR